METHVECAFMRTVSQSADIHHAFMRIVSHSADIHHTFMRTALHSAVIHDGSLVNPPLLPVPVRLF